MAIADRSICRCAVDSDKRLKRRRVIHQAASFVFASAIWSAATLAPAAEMVLAENGQSTFKIVLADDASPSTRYAADELQMFIEEMTDVRLPIVSDQTAAGPHEIVLGDNAHMRELGVEIDFAALGLEGYVIRTAGGSLAIAGSEARGTLYGVYGFLEDHLGCRWFAPGVNRIPRKARLAIDAIDDRQAPAFEYRELFLLDCFADSDWCARNRINASHGDFQEKHGGKMSFGDGFFCHTFEQLVPPEKYYDDHPEYFALVNEERRREQQGISAQLCCTNPDVIRICTKEVRKAMRAQPWATMFSISQNDSYEPTPENDRYEPGFCECRACQALVQQEDSQIAPVLQLVNHVAQSVEKEFPNKRIETLAYQWTCRPPRRMRPLPNVVIRLCTSGGCCCSHPLQTCDGVPSEAFRADFEGWAKIAPRLWVWDYITDFNHYLLPIPNHRICSVNIRYFAAHNVKGVFLEDAGDTLNGELAALSGFMAAKSLWNPNFDANQAMHEFLEGYYGQASVPIGEYIALLYSRAQSENIHVTPSADCDSIHLTDELLIKANELWRTAEELTSAEPEVHARVTSSRMSLDFAIVERARLQAQRKLPVNKELKSLAAARFKPFMEALQNSTLTCLSAGTPLEKDSYGRELANDLGLAAE